MDQGVGHEVKRLREQRGWSQAKLAVEADMSVSGVSMIENGQRNLTTTTLSKLASAFGIEIADLFPKDQAPLPLELEEQRGADEERREREKYAEALMVQWAEEGEYLEEEIKSSSGGFPLWRAHTFNLGRSFAGVLYEEIESTRQPPKALQEAKSRLDAQSDRIGTLWQQTMHPGSGEALDEFKRFAMRRAEASRGEVDEEGAHSASREGKSSA